MPDAELVQQIDGLTPVILELRLYRLMSGRYQPVSGEGARAMGGRWNPPESFPTLYLGSSVDTAVAEVQRGFAAQGRRLEEAVGLVIYEVDVQLSAVLDLREPAALDAVGLVPGDIAAPDRRRCQAVGDAAHFIGLEGVWAPSAAGPGEVVAIFTDKQRPGSVIAPSPAKPWP